MLGRARRPPRPNYISTLCKTLKQLMKIDNKLRPFMKEQAELLKQMEWEDHVKAMVRKVYGEDPPANPPPLCQNSKTGKETVKKR